MTPIEALNKAIRHAGSRGRLALLIGITPQAVYNWRGAVPAERVLAVEVATGVSRHDLRPDIYPPVTDQRPLLTVKSRHLGRVHHGVDTERRRRRNNHRGGVLWFTGLPAAGKSTLAQAAERALFERGYQVYLLDGDNIRAGLSADLGFSPADRAENIRRIGEVAALFADAGMIVLTAFISPYLNDRKWARAAVALTADGAEFHEIYVKADLATCEARDPKGLYERARRGEIADFTGLSAPYEPPETPDLLFDTERQSVAECLARLLDYVEAHFALER